jgi:peptidoglycan/xylan/chitin deacetylase (PgdA/CDA1 family)
MSQVIPVDMYEIIQKDPEIWNLFTRKEEYTSSFRDHYGRFPYYASSNRNIFEPVASKFLIEQGYRMEYPEGKPFAVCLTHDIDGIYTPVLPKAISAMRYLRKGSLSEFMHSVGQLRSKKLPLWNFNDILALEEKYGAKSSFYFMAEDYGERDYSYRIEDCESALGDIVDSGSEVGLHGGHTSFSSPGELKSKKARMEKIINKKITGYRNHYLRFKVPETWEYLHEAGFLYDSTLGYADCIGFRNGMCHPFKPFNLNTGQSIGIVEIPLIIMEDTLDRYMGLDSRLGWEISKQLIDTVMKYNGVLTLLWHNYSFFGEQKILYEKILKYCLEKNAWMASGKEISSWWTQYERP